MFKQTKYTVEYVEIEVSITCGIIPVRRSLFELEARVLHKVEAVYFGGGQVCWIVGSLHWHHHSFLFKQRKFRF